MAYESPSPGRAARAEYDGRDSSSTWHDAAACATRASDEGVHAAICGHQGPERGMVRRLQGKLPHSAMGSRVTQLTVIDAHSRLLLRCEGLLEPDGRHVQRVFDSAFSEFGLPAAIRSDNGPPFASAGAGGLTKVSVWWIRLGIRLRAHRTWQTAAERSTGALPSYAEGRNREAASSEPARTAARVRRLP